MSGLASENEYPRPEWPVVGPHGLGVAAVGVTLGGVFGAACMLLALETHPAVGIVLWLACYIVPVALLLWRRMAFGAGFMVGLFLGPAITMIGWVVYTLSTLPGGTWTD